MKYAVISNPRTGSRALANRFVNEYETEIGYIHFTQSVQSSCLTYDQLISQDWILHGHWHTISKLSKDHQNWIRENYKIHHIKRDHEHRFASAIIVMKTGNINFSRDGIPKHIEFDYVYEYVKRMRPAYDNFLNWEVDTIHDFDEIYNDDSETNFQLNTSRIENYEELSKLYHDLIKWENHRWTF